MKLFFILLTIISTVILMTTVALLIISGRASRIEEIYYSIGGQKEMEQIKIKYFNKNIKKIEQTSIGDWIDLRAAADVTLKKNEFKLIPLGIGMILPDGYEAHVVPRSSTYKNFKIIQTNHQGVIDSSYCGDNDQWHFPAYALEDTVIHFNDRICQFRIIKKQPIINFEEVATLTDKDRGGIGSTGIQ